MEWLTVSLCASICRLYMEEGMDLEQWFSNVVPAPAVPAWPRNLLEMQIIWPYPRPPESETRGRPQQH